MNLSDKEKEELSQAASEILRHPEKLREFLEKAVGEDSFFSMIKDSADVEKTIDVKNNCDHGVAFDEEDAKTLSTSQIRQKYPRGWGPCPKGCGFDGIAYASYLHYIMGDW